MFNFKKKNLKTNPSNNVFLKENTRNILGSTTRIKGDIFSEGDFRIEGQFEGDINIKGKLVAGKNSQITGNIKCENAEIEGNLKGNLVVRDLLFLKSTAVYKGEMIIKRLVIEMGAVYNGICTMSKDIHNTYEETKK